MNNQSQQIQGNCQTEKGFTFIELIVYVATFAIVITVVTLFVFSLIQAQAKARIMEAVSNNSQRVMEIITLEIKNAQDIYLPDSVFDQHPGKLTVKTIRYRPEGEATTYLDFYLNESSQLLFKREGEPAESLTSKNIKIEKLIFKHLTASSTESIQIELTAVYESSSQQAAYRATSTLTSSAALRYHND